MMTPENYLSLSKAIKEDDLESVERLIDQGCDVGKVDTDTGLNFLHLAVLEGRYRIVELMSRDGKHVNSQCRKNLSKQRIYKGYTALHMSCTTGNIEITELLLSKGTSIKVDEDQCTALHVAVGKEDPKIVEILLRADPSCANCHDYLGRTALLYTAMNKGTDSINLLLKYGADIGLIDDEGMTVLHLAAFHTNESIVEILLKNARSIIDCLDNYRWTALHWAVYKGHISIVKLLLNSDKIVDLYNQHRVHSQEGSQHEAVANDLMQNLTKNREESDFCYTPLRVLSCSTCSTKLRLLKESAANVNLVDRGDNGPLQLAAQDNNCEIVRLVLKHGPDIEVGNNLALHTAIKFGSIEVVEELLKFGAKIDLYALRIAYCKNQFEVFKLLVNQGWKLEFEEVYKLLDETIVCHNVDFVQLFFSSGIKIEYLDDVYKNIGLPKIIYNFVRYCVSWIDGNVPCYVRTGVNGECVMSFIHNNHIALKRWFVEKFPEAKSAGFTVNKFFNSCLKEVELMKCELVGDSNVSLFDLLEKDLDELVKCLRNGDLVDGWKQVYSFAEFPICGEVLRVHLDRGLRRRVLLDQCVKCFSCAYSGWPTLLPEIVEIIFSMLTNRDLNAFCFACNSLI